MKIILSILLTAFAVSVTAAVEDIASSKADFYVSTGGSDAWSGTLADANAQGNDGLFATLAVDPLFIDAAKRGRLRPESPAFKVGFVPLDLSLVGLRPQL